jgi:hypothetical protein
VPLHWVTQVVACAGAAAIISCRDAKPATTTASDLARPVARLRRDAKWASIDMLRTVRLSGANWLQTALASFSLMDQMHPDSQRKSGPEDEATATETRHPAVLGADRWAHEHRDFLIACFERFARDGAWPEVERLQHDLELREQRLDAWAAASQMPSQLGFIEEQRLVLRVRALEHIPAAEGLLCDWFRVLKLADRAWRADPDQRFKRSDVLRAVDGDATRARAVSVLLLRESWAFGSGQGGPDDAWERELLSAVRIAGVSRSPQELIAARDAVEYPPSRSAHTEPDSPAPASVQNSRPIRNAIVRAWHAASNNQILAAVVAAAFIAVAGLIINSVGRRNGSSTEAAKTQSTPSRGAGLAPPAGPGRRERAGSGGARTYADAGQLSQEQQSLKPNQAVMVSCKIYSPQPPSVVPDGYWYRVTSPPWNGHAFAPANSFWNGDVPGHKPYTHNTDRAVPDCR